MTVPAGTSAKDIQVIPELFDEAVEAAFFDKMAFLGSGLASNGVVVVRGTMPESGPDVIGNKISVPYFESLGDFQDLATDGDQITPVKVGMTREDTFIKRSGLAFQITQWARSNPLGDVYQNGAQQLMLAATRRMDKAVIDAAVDSSISGPGLVLDKFSATNPRFFDYDLFVDGKMQWRDWQDDVAAVVMHSKTLAQSYKMKDALGRPLLLDPKDGSLPRIMGVPIVVSDRLPVSGSTMSTNVAGAPFTTITGTTPPTLTLYGPGGSGAPAPTRAMDLVVACVAAGARGVWTLKWSIDGGNSYIQDGTVVPYVLSAANVEITDAQGNSLGVNIAIATGNAATDNVWKVSTTNKLTTLLCKKGALAFWYNQSALRLKTLEQPLNDSEIAAVWMYFIAHRYKRLRGTPLPGIVQIRHN